MKIHRFIGDFNLSKKQLFITEAKLVHQLFAVLKIQKDEKIVLSDGQGKEVLALVVTASPKKYQVELQEYKSGGLASAQRLGGTAKRQIILYCSILKKENFELVAQKATEVGVSVIVPIVAERTIKLNINSERLNKIIQEAAEQSGRSRLPKILEPMSFNQSLAHSKNNNLNIIYQLGGKTIAAIQPRLIRAKTIGVFVGPEGGWSPKELAQSKSAGFELISLGQTVLRAETAAIIGSFLASQ